MTKKPNDKSSCYCFSGKTSILRYVWIIFFILSIITGVFAYFFHESNAWIDNNGIMHEPYFFLVLLTIIVLFFGVVLCLIDMFISFLKKPI